MDEIDLMVLIAEGENERLDFKRELELHSGKGKAEFVKDIISLANSASGVGYLLVGVDDNKLIIGAAHLEEERLQQISSTYVTPPVHLRCYSLHLEAPDFSLVGVIEIRAFQRPHKVARAIDSLFTKPRRRLCAARVSGYQGQS
jgi:predicted HTH transcriptional regulator